MSFDKLNVIANPSTLEQPVQLNWDISAPIGKKQTGLQIIYATNYATIGNTKSSLSIALSQ